MGRSRVGWMFGAVAPWCLGVGLAVSVPADAGVDSTIGASFAPDMLSPSLDAPDDLIPASAGRVHLAYAGGLIPLREARLNVGEPQDFADRPPAEQEPRRDLKPKASGFPEANRATKGDPFVGLRPTFDARLRANGIDGYREAALASSRRYLAFEGLQESADPQQQLDAAQTLKPVNLPRATLAARRDRAARAFHPAHIWRAFAPEGRAAVSTARRRRSPAPSRWPRPRRRRSRSGCRSCMRPRSWMRSRRARKAKRSLAKAHPTGPITQRL